VWKPLVVLRVEDGDGRVVQEFAPQERSRVAIKKTTREVVLNGLLAAVNEPYGTAWWSRLKDVPLAGKTGTAQVQKLGARRLKASQMAYFERDHAWFATFAPADDPEIVVVVLNEHSGFGASNAAPTATAVVKRWLELKAQDAAERAGPLPLPAAPPPAAPPKPDVPARGPEEPKLGEGAQRAAGGAAHG
jgi:penicillin-binding protein 2